LSKATQLCEAAGNAEDGGGAYSILEWIYMHRGEFDKALAAKDEALRKMGEQFSLRTYVRALAHATMALSHLGQWDKAVEEGKKALSVAQEFSDNSQSSYAAMSLSGAYTAKGDLERGIEYAELAVQIAPTPADKAWAQGALAWTWCRAGETHKGIEVLAPLVQVFRGVRLVPSQLGYGMFLGDGYLLAGEYEKARQTVEEVLEIAGRCGSKLFQGCAHLLLGEIASRTDPAQAPAHFDKSMAISESIKAENYLALAYAGYGRLHKQQGNPVQAREYLLKALEIFERLGTLIEPDKVRRELAELAEIG
jgi:tetratricopeptide (TPR) repeat protein